MSTFSVPLLAMTSSDIQCQGAVGYDRKIQRARLLKRSKSEGLDINASMAEAEAKAAAPAGQA